MEIERNEPNLRFARQKFSISTENGDNVDLAGVVLSEGLKITILFNSGRLIVLDLAKAQPNKMVEILFDLPFHLPQVEENAQNQQLQDTRKQPFAFVKGLVGFINAQKRRIEYLDIANGQISEAFGPKIALPTDSVRAAVGEDVNNLGAYYKNGVQIITLPESETIVVMEMLDILQTNKKLELYLTAFSKNGTEINKCGPLTIQDNTMYYLARSNFKDSIIYYNQEFQDSKLTFNLWRKDWARPLVVKLKRNFTGTLYDIKPLENDVLFLIGNTQSHGVDGPDTEANPAVYGPEHKLLDLRNQEWVEDGVVELDDTTFQVHVHTDGSDVEKKPISKFHLRDLIAVNPKNQNVITEIFCNNGLYIDVLNLKNALNLLNQNENNDIIQLEENFISQQLKFAETTRPDDGVAQYIVSADDGSYALGFEDCLDGTESENEKRIDLILYHFVENQTTVQWLAEEAQLGKIFDLPGIVKGVQQKFPI